MSNNMLKAAMWYLDQGYSIIPVKGKSKHLVKWAKYQSEKPSKEQVQEWWGEEFIDANIAIITGKISGITVVDIDSYKLNDEQKAEVEKSFPTVATPTVISASGGEHRYFAYSPGVPTKNDVMTGLDIKNDGGLIIAPPSQNGKGKYEWVPRKKINELSLRSVPDSYLNSINALDSINSLYIYNSKNSLQDLTNLTEHNIYFTPGRRDQDLFHAGNCLIRGGADPGFTKQTLEFIANNLGKEFGPKVVDQKIGSILRRAGQKEINIAAEVKDWIDLTEGYFNLTNILQDLTLHNKNQKATLYVTINRLCKEGVIEKHGDKRGVYRRVEQSTYEDWMNAEYNAIKFNMPFNIDEFVDIFPGDMIVIAGVKNAGKTALALNFMEYNLKGFDCYYHSSELVPQTFKMRIMKSKNKTLEDWKNVKMTHGLSMTNAKDRVVKDALNIFDYVEGDDGEFYKIPATMARIHRALGNGVAVICLQKPSDRSFARGGEGTKDKAALYLTIDKEYPYHVCRITECKVFKENPGNPTGNMIKYKIVDGINLHPDGMLSPELDDKYSKFDKG